MKTVSESIASTKLRMHDAKPGWAYALRRLRALVRPPVTVTPPPGGVIFERNRAVRTRDGTTLRVNVFRPSSEGRFPVLMCAHPYGKDELPRSGRPLFTYRLMYQTKPLTHSAWTGWEGPDPAFWVPRGYVLVNADLRGYGSSEGTGNLLTQAEGQDYYDLIEWARATALVYRQGRPKRRIVSRRQSVACRVIAAPVACRHLPLGGLDRSV